MPENSRPLTKTEIVRELVRLQHRLAADVVIAPYNAGRMGEVVTVLEECLKKRVPVELLVAVAGQYEDHADHLNEHLVRAEETLLRMKYLVQTLLGITIIPSRGLTGQRGQSDPNKKPKN